MFCLLINNVMYASRSKHKHLAAILYLLVLPGNGWQPILMVLLAYYLASCFKLRRLDRLSHSTILDTKSKHTKSSCPQPYIDNWLSPYIYLISYCPGAILFLSDTFPSHPLHYYSTIWHKLPSICYWNSWLRRYVWYPPEQIRCLPTPPRHGIRIVRYWLRAIHPAR